MPEDMGSVIAQMSREILPDQKQPESASERAGALILRLPRELRDMIYEHIIPSEDVSYPDHGDVMLRHHNSTLLTGSLTSISNMLASLTTSRLFDRRADYFRVSLPRALDFTHPAQAL